MTFNGLKASPGARAHRPVWVWFRKPFPRAGSLWRAALAALVPAGLLVALMLVLQPMGIGNHGGVMLLFQVLAFGLCLLIPPIAFWPAESAWSRFRGGGWRRADEVVAMIVMTSLALVAGHVLNELTLNRWPEPDFSAAALGEFVISVGLPYSLFIVPAWLGARYWLGEPDADSGDGSGVFRIRGHNEGELVVIPAGAFRYAEAEQNYVQLHYLRGDRLTSHLLRIPLGKIAEQAPGLIRVHRSFLVWPEAIERLEGPARRARVWLHDVTDPVPVSQRQYPRVAELVESSSHQSARP